MTLQGISGSRGFALGRVLVFDKHLPVISQARINKAEINEEMEKFRSARKSVDQALVELCRNSDRELPQEVVDIFEGHREILNDEEMEADLFSLLENDRLNIAAAVHRYMEDNALEMEELDDEYLRERATDFRDLRDRLIFALNGKLPPALTLLTLTEPVLLVAADLAPSDTAMMRKKFIKGFALEQGGKTSHVCVMARGMGIPAVVGARDLLKNLKTGDSIILNGDEGFLIARPNELQIQEHEKKLRARQQTEKRLAAIRDKKGVTRDGKAIGVFANAGGLDDIKTAVTRGAQGIGLLRTEFLYLKSTPKEEELFKIFKAAVKQTAGGPVIIRTLDAGGDKKLKAVPIEAEENPFLGYRGARVYEEYKQLFVSQIRAAYRAAAFGNLRLMYPMITSVKELLELNQICRAVKEQLWEEGVPVGPLPTGVMIETPAAALVADALARHTRFFSIGSNDLTQYALAVDRGNPRISNMFNSFHPAVIKLMDMAAQAAARAGIEVGLCGEFAGNPRAVPLLVGMGMDELSITGALLPMVKDIILKITYQEAVALKNEVLDMSTAAAVYARLDEWFEQRFKNYDY